MLSFPAVLLRCCLLSLLLLGVRGQFSENQVQISCSSEDTCDASAVCGQRSLFCGLEAQHTTDGRTVFSSNQCCEAGWSCRSGWNDSAQAAGGSWRSGFDCVQDGSAAYQASIDRIAPPRAPPVLNSEYCAADDSCWAVSGMQNFTSCMPTCTDSSPCPAPDNALNAAPIAYCGLAQVDMRMANRAQSVPLPQCCHTGWQCRPEFYASISAPMMMLQVNISGYDCMLQPQTAGSSGVAAPTSAPSLLGAFSSSSAAAFHPRQMQIAEQLNSTGQSLYDACESLTSCYVLEHQCSVDCAAGAECGSPDVIACGGTVTASSGRNHFPLPACCQKGWQCTDGFSGSLPMPAGSIFPSINITGFSCQLPLPTAAVTAAATATASATATSSSSGFGSSSLFGFSDSSSSSSSSGSSSAASTGVRSLTDDVNDELRQLSEEYHVSRGVVTAVAVAAALLGLSLLGCALYGLWRVCCVYRVKYSAMSGQDDAHEDVGLQHVTDLPIDDGREQTEWERDAVLGAGERQHEPDGI